MAGYNMTAGGACTPCGIGLFKDTNSNTDECLACSGDGSVTTLSVGANDASLCGKFVVFFNM